MRNIYLVTHPEATHQLAGLVGGWYDSALTHRGNRHAHDIARALSARFDIEPADVISSDLRRAAETAHVIGASLGSRVLLDPELREKSFGAAEGHDIAWLRDHAIPLPDEGERLRHDEGIRGAESRWDLAQRCYRAMSRLVASPAEHQVVVTHGGPVTMLIAAWIGMPAVAAGRAGFPVASGSITWLRKHPRTFSHEVVQLGDTSHLS